MTEKIVRATRERVTEAYPAIADKVLGNYEDMINKGVEKFHKDANHKAYHDACKAAVTHLHLLLKLAAWVETPEEKAAPPSDKMEGIIRLLEERDRDESAAYNDEGEMV